MDGVGKVDGFIHGQTGHQALIKRDEFLLLFHRSDLWQGLWLAIFKPQPGQKLDAAGMRVVQTKLSGNMRPDLDCGPAKPSFQPLAQYGLLRLRHARLATFPGVNSKGFPSVSLIGLVPATDGVVVQIKKRRDFLARSAVVQQKDRIGTTGNAVILALTTNTGLKFKALFWGKETGTVKS